MVTGHGFGLEDTSNLEHAVLEPIPVANVEKKLQWQAACRPTGWSPSKLAANKNIHNETSSLN